ncbi:MAG TPA: tetratricopeptide repeat protein [Candidatus Methanoperedens sp.]|nr:tetratricopeptide repeat protein [Candidatus Methanoperedens sp.]
MRRGGRSRVFGAALVLAVLAPVDAPAAKRGDIVPLFKATDLAGRPVQLGEIVARRRVAIFFWDWRRATSTRAMQVLDRLQATYKDKGLDVLAVEGEGSTAEQVADRVEKLRAIGIRQAYTILADPGGRIARQFGLTGTPQVFLVDGAGRVYEHFESLRAEDDRTLERQVRELLRLEEATPQPAPRVAAPAVASSSTPPPPVAPAPPADPKQALLEKYRYFGDYHLNRGEFAKAEDYFRKFVELVPGDTAAWLRVGDVCARQGRYDAAREAWERVLRIDPGNAEADTAIRRLVRGEY